MTASSVDVKTPITKADAKTFYNYMGTEGQDKLIMLPLNFMSTEQVKSTINGNVEF